MKFLIEWWLKRIAELANIFHVIVITIAVVVGIGWSTLWFFGKYVQDDGVAIGSTFVVMVCFSGGVYFNGLRHRAHLKKCQRRLIPVVHCDSCDATNSKLLSFLSDIERINKSAQAMREIVQALVCGSQDQLDDLLRIFAERVQSSCRQQSALLAKKESERSPKETLQLQILTNEINRDKIQYANIQKYAPQFGLIVSSGWSAYYPER